MKTTRSTLQMALACAALSLPGQAPLQAQESPAPGSAAPVPLAPLIQPLPVSADPTSSPASESAKEEERLKADIHVFDSQRPEVAQAIFRLGECYRQLKRFEEARIQYARILREFTDSPDLVRESSRLLLELGKDNTAQAGAPVFQGSGSSLRAGGADPLKVPVLSDLPIMGKMFRESPAPPRPQPPPSLDDFATPSPGLAPAPGPVPVPPYAPTPGAPFAGKPKDYAPKPPQPDEKPARGVGNYPPAPAPIVPPAPPRP